MSTTLSTTSPRSGRRLRAALFALALGGFTIGTAEFVLMGLLPEVAGGVGVSLPHAGHAVSAYALGVVVGAPLLAAAGARVPRRALALGLMAAFGLGNLLSALAPDYTTLVVSRFVAGLPHGAYFGIAALIAADLSDPARRARAVSRVLLGLAVANVVGVPAATWLGQTLGWRAGFVTVAVLAAATVVCILRAVPPTPADRSATVRRELAALGRVQVWLTLGIGAIGGGGMFAVYSYISPIMTGRAGVSTAVVPVALAIWGLGMVAGSLIGGRLADWRLTPAAFGVLVAMALFFACFALVSTSPVLAVGSVFLLGLGVALPTILQVRLMDVSGDAQTLGAALNHSSFNVANALGAWLGGLALAGGLGLGAPAWIAVALTLGGIVLLGVATILRRREARGGTGRRVDVEEPVHFHRGPQGLPAVCHNLRCAIPHLDVC